MANIVPDYSKIPLQPPPPGVTSNFVNPPTLAGTVIAVTAVLIVLSTTCVLLRLYTRLMLVCFFDAGDYLLLVGYAFAVANSAVAMAQTKVGLGRHAWDIPLSTQFPRSMICVWVEIKLYIVSLGFTKSAILYLYPRISPSRSFRICVWLLLGLVACITVATLIWDITFCLPISNYWTLEAAYKCPSQNNFLYFTGIANIATDFAILILPVLTLRHVAIPTKKKIGVGIVLAIGSFVGVISVIRLVFSTKDTGKYDEVYKGVFIYLWSAAEQHVAVICACLTTMRPLIRHFFPSLGDSSASKSKSTPHQRRTRVIELNERGVKLRELKSDEKSSSRRGGNSSILKEKGLGNNSSDEYILIDKDFTIVESGKEQSDLRPSAR